jgi:hypothetical protein
MSKLLVTFAALAALLACSSTPTWREQKVGPLALQFPCEPQSSGSVVKCSLSDGTEFSVATIEKKLPDAEEIAQTKQYVEGIPNSQLLKGDAFPLRWRESRRTVIFDATLYYVGGVEYVVGVSYTTTSAPPIAAEFVSKVKLQP